jgi:hypothetical protein
VCVCTRKFRFRYPHWTQLLVKWRWNEEDCTGLGTKWNLHWTQGHDEVFRTSVATAARLVYFCLYSGESSRSRLARWCLQPRWSAGERGERRESAGASNLVAYDDVEPNNSGAPKGPPLILCQLADTLRWLARLQVRVVLAKKSKPDTQTNWSTDCRPQEELQLQRHITTDVQSGSVSWCQAQSGTFDQRFFFSKLRSCLCWAPSLTRGRVYNFSVVVLAPENGRFYTKSVVPDFSTDWLDSRSVLRCPEKGRNRS